MTTFGQAIGVLMVINLAEVKRLHACLKMTFWLVGTIAAPLLAYASLYGKYPLNVYLIDLSQNLIGYLAMAAIYADFRGKDKVGIA